MPEWLIHILTVLVSVAATYGWLRGPMGMVSKFEAQLMADVAHIKQLLALGLTSTAVPGQPPAQAASAAPGAPTPPKP